MKLKRRNLAFAWMKKYQQPPLEGHGCAGRCMMLFAVYFEWHSRFSTALSLLMGIGFYLSGVAGPKLRWYIPRGGVLPDLSDAAMTDLAHSKDRLKSGPKQTMEPLSVSYPAWRTRWPIPVFPPTSAKFADEIGKGFTVLKDGTEELHIPLSDEATRIYSQNLNKGVDEPSFEMKIVVNKKTVVSEKRYETFVDGVMRPNMLRLDYPGGAIIQLFEYTNTPPAPLPPVYLRKVGVDDDAKSDVYPKSWVTKADGETQTRDVQFIVPQQGLGNLGFDSGWVPGGSGPDPGGFIIQVRLNAQAGYTYDAAVNGTFNLYPFESYSELGLGPAMGNWGFYFGAEFYMKAALIFPQPWL